MVVSAAGEGMLMISEGVARAVESVLASLTLWGRSASTVMAYEKVLGRFTAYWARDGDGRDPTEADCVRYVGVDTGESVDALDGRGCSSRVRVMCRALRLLLDSLEGGPVLVERPRRQPVDELPVGFAAVLREYLAVCARRGNSTATVWTKHDMGAKFLKYLHDDARVSRLAEVTVRDVSGFLVRGRWRRKTTASAISMLRDFMGFLYQTGRIGEDLAGRLPMPRHVRSETVPYLWTVDEVRQVLAAVDRSSAIGKRDYAMLLVVARLGLRPEDLRRLTFAAFDWQAKTITITQHKTERALVLPLLDDVGWAVIDYARNGRPDTPHQEVFVKHRYPYDRFVSLAGATSRLYTYVSKAGLQLPQDRVHGLHSFRGALAVAMLANGTRVPVITGVLGHANSVTTTAYYLRLDIEHLRGVAIDVEDIIAAHSSGVVR